ncbi:Xaa-Pro peptidase family protein [Eubacteriales bacterium OttesenSCG-928-A19]|nr:Xaa-Pro peptidase family protein [Eubacteriales bacterium OttesenSCG-928-A19]
MAVFAQRTDRLLSRLAEAGMQGALVHKPSNIRWLSGYTGEGLLVIAPGLRAIVTDFRYTEQAQQQAPDYTVHMTTATDKHEQVAGRLVREAGLTVVGFEDDEVTVSGFAALEAAMEGVRFLPQRQCAEALRVVKDDGEVALIARACDISCKAFEHVLGVIKPGMTELELRLELENAMYRFGAEKMAFDTIIATGANGALPHAIPGDRRIEKGHMVTMDFGAKYGGYCADMTRTVAVGSLDDDKRRVYATVLEAQLRALDAIKPGAACREVDAIARDYIEEQGYAGRFGHGLGHCLGLDIHEDPRFNTISEATLVEGIVITDEPGIYLPGDCGCRIEDTVLVTADGARRLTPASKDLIIL